MKYSDVLVGPLYIFLRFMRLVFLSGRVGAFVHNLFFYWMFRIFAGEPQVRLTEKLRDSLTKYPLILEWQRKCYSSYPKVVRHLIKNIFVRRFAVASWTRRRLARAGHIVPNIVMVSLNTPEAGCNLTCTGCYAFGHNHVSVMPLTVLTKVLDEQERLGIYTVLFLGGEPFLYRGIMDVFRAYPRTSFYVATNGTKITAEMVSRLADMGNICPMISIDGFQESTDAVRGRGVYQQVLATMQLFKDARLPYAATVTVTRQNRREVTGHRFLGMLESYRCCGVNYSCYVAIGRSPHPEMQLSVAESEALDDVRELILRNFTLFPSVGRNGVARVNSCSAAREYFHVLPNGQVESCPFAQWADPTLNMATHSILEVMASPFFSGIRELNRYGVSAATPCRAQGLKSLQQGFKQLGAQTTIYK